MKQIVGTITIVQEGRFRLSTPDGRSLHFALASHSGSGAGDLAAFCARMAHVQVAYDQVDGRSNLVAHQVREMGMPPG